uniref:Uncharacterized protein n=1 Tax=Arundo donax TaxID=35708 RepID=A0A0A8Y6J1_ARUDO
MGKPWLSCPHWSSETIASSSKKMAQLQVTMALNYY